MQVVFFFSLLASLDVPLPYCLICSCGRTRLTLMNSWLILRQQQMAMQVASYTYTCEFLYQHIRTQQTTPGPRAAPPLLGTRMQTVSFSSRSLIKASPTQSSATESVLYVFSGWVASLIPYSSSWRATRLLLL
jgi:hypothetical protein